MTDFFTIFALDVKYKEFLEENILTPFYFEAFSSLSPAMHRAQPLPGNPSAAGTSVYLNP
ncbi:hypothetical protein AD930_01050 [Acetobacter malorum]|nr:hypothetical protein AD930_01050 [Acetobacter malorum]